MGRRACRHGSGSCYKCKRGLEIFTGYSAELDGFVNSRLALGVKNIIELGEFTVFDAFVDDVIRLEEAFNGGVVSLSDGSYLNPIVISDDE